MKSYTWNYSVKGKASLLPMFVTVDAKSVREAKAAALVKIGVGGTLHGDPRIMKGKAEVKTPPEDLIALVYMEDDEDDFFIENCPQGPPQNWIERFVHNISEVQHVEVYERTPLLASWSNPNASSEE